jgi:CBS domain-containing protein
MGKNIKDAMTSNPCSIDAERSVSYAAKMMRDENVGLAPIVEGDRLVGTLTDRDIATRVVAEGRDPDATKAGDVASRDVITVTPEGDLDDALQLMAKHQVRRLPVVENGGRLVGVVAQADVAEHSEPEKTGRMVEETSQN